MPSRAESLRRSFDRAFAEPHHAGAEPVENMLGVRIGGDACAIRLAEIAGLHADVRIVPLPTPAAELLGIASLRSGIVPVYGLQLLLGYPMPGEAPRWLVVTASARPVGLAFDQLDGCLHVGQSELARGQDNPASAHLRETARVGGMLRTVVSIPSIVEALNQRFGGIDGIKER